MLNDIRIPVTVGGVEFKNPFFVASGPTTKSVAQLKRIEETGWAAASIKLSIDPAPYINRKPRYAMFKETNALAFTAEKRLTFEQGLELVRESKKVLTDLKLFANITYAGDAGVSGWVNMAKKFEEAGADIIELNMCCPNMSYNVSLTSGGGKSAAKQTGASLGQQGDAVAEIVREIKKVISIPLFVKLTPEGGQIATIAAALYEAGADAVGGTGNRLGIPDLDLDHPEKAIYHLQDEASMSCYCGNWLKPLAQRDTYEIRKVNGNGPKIMAAGGITNWKDAVEMVLCGGNLLGICAETLISGFDIVRPMIKGMKDYMDKHGYKTIDDFCGKIVPELKTAPELTIYDGYAQIINPNLAGPCKAACPLHVPVQAYVSKIAKGEFKEAYDLIISKGALQGACAYVCAHPCEDACVRGEGGEPVKIRELKKFVLQMAKKEGWDKKEETIPANGKKVAVLGSGPMGLSAACDLSRAGYDVTVFEKQAVIGGSLNTMVASGRLPECVLNEIIDDLKNKGVKFEVNSKDDVSNGFDAVVNGFLPNEVKINENVKCGYGLLMGEDTVVNGKNIVISGKGENAFDLALYAVSNGAASVVIAGSGMVEGRGIVKELISEVKAKGVKFANNLEFVSFDGKVATFKGSVGETVTINCDEVYNGDAWSKNATIVAACAKGVNEAARVDKELMGDKAVLTGVESVTPVKKENVLKRNGYLGDTKKAESVIETCEDAIKEASRCLKCGCGEGCQLCKTICSEFAIYNPKKDKIEIHGDECVACGMCFNRCPNKNIEMVNTGVKV
ncbi:MAG: NAD(P)-binding protein [Clostridia bacterium]|nr:NAD(P)-binding protein [Clostridia bacterium]